MARSVPLLTLAASVSLLAACQTLLGVDDYGSSGRSDGGGGSSSQGSGAQGGATGSQGGAGVTGGFGGAVIGVGGSGGAPACGWMTPTPLNSTQVLLASLKGQGGAAVDVGGVAIVDQDRVVLAASADIAATGLTYQVGSNLAASVAPTLTGTGCVILQLQIKDFAFERAWWTSDTSAATPDCNIGNVVADGVGFWVVGDATSSQLEGTTSPLVLTDSMAEATGFALNFEVSAADPARVFFAAGAGHTRLTDVAVAGADQNFVGDYTGQACLLPNAPVGTPLPGDCPVTDCPMSTTCLLDDWNGPGAHRPTAYTAGPYYGDASVAVASGHVFGASERHGVNGPVVLSRYQASPITSYEFYQIRGADVRSEAAATSGTVHYAVGAFGGGDLNGLPIETGATQALLGTNASPNRAGFLVHVDETLATAEAVTVESQLGDTNATAVAVSADHLVFAVHTSLPATFRTPAGAVELGTMGSDGTLLIVVDEPSGCVRYHWLGNDTTIDALSLKGSDLIVAGTYKGSVALPGATATGDSSNVSGFVAHVRLD